MQPLVRLCFSALAATVLGTSALAASSFAKVTDTRVTFHAVGPAGLKIEGTTQELGVVEDASNVVISVPLAKLQTGIDVRDRHMRDKYLEVDKYPEAKLVLERSRLSLPSAPNKVTGEAPALLTLHGQTKPTRVRYTISGDGTGYTVEGTLLVNMTEVGIVVPVYLGVTVKPDVNVDVHFHVSGN